MSAGGVHDCKNLDRPVQGLLLSVKALLRKEIGLPMVTVKSPARVLPVLRPLHSSAGALRACT